VRRHDEQQLTPATQLGIDPHGCVEDIVVCQPSLFFVAPLPIGFHIPTVVVYSVLGELHFGPDFRQRHRAWHRSAYRILIPCGLLAARSARWITNANDDREEAEPLPYVEWLGFFSAMVTAILLGISAIVRRDFSAHGDWMIRAYATRRTGVDCPPSHQIKPIRVHNLGPRRHEGVHEHLLRIIGGIHLAERPQLRIRSENQIHSRRRPLYVTSDTIAPFK
jgi:hypothetical protein